MNLTGSVGQNAINSTADQLIVTRLLNGVPVNEGGPSHPLSEDPLHALPGLERPLLVLAIHTFQKRQFRTSDGRVESGQETWQRLQDLSHHSLDGKRRDLHSDNYLRNTTP